MRVKAAVELVYVFEEATQVLALIQAARSPAQTILSERLSVEPAGRLAEDADASGQRLLRGSLSGEVSIRYEAVVDNGPRLLLPPAAGQLPWNALPAEVLPYLLPSRFCPSDSFQRFAMREFGAAGDGVARVMAVMDWIGRHVDYVPGVSTAESTAQHTFTVRAGVCRDFAHLGITLCRALSIPARAVSAYAAGLDPPDFHAVMEVHLEGGWYLVDPTRLAPLDGLVRIARGRDAADIAFLTTDRPCKLVRQSVAAEPA